MDLFVILLVSVGVPTGASPRCPFVADTQAAGAQLGRVRREREHREFRRKREKWEASQLSVSLFDNDVWRLPQMIVCNSRIVRQQASESHGISGRAAGLAHVVRDKLLTLLGAVVVGLCKRLTFSFITAASDGRKFFGDRIGIRPAGRTPVLDAQPIATRDAIRLTDRLRAARRVV
jgi:hypothetical protein